MKSLARWFTNDRRQALQAAIGTLLPLLALVGWIDDNQAGAIIATVAAFLQLGQGLLGLVLLRASERARWLGTALRGLVYALAAAVGPLGVAFRWWGDDTAAVILTVVGMGLTAFAAFLQVVNVQTITPLPDPATATRAEYQSALEQGE